MITALWGCRRLPPAPLRPGDDPAFPPAAEVELPGFAEPPPAAYALLPGDVVRLRVTSADPLDLSDLVVDAAGLLHVPQAGDVPVGGLALGAAEERVRAALEPHDRYARVILTLASPAGHRATVLGQVVRPGSYDLKPEARLAELLALAGGLRAVDADGEAYETADLEAARVYRAGAALPVRLDRALAGDLRHNLRVAPGDLVVVPPARGARVVVLGAVHNPRALPFRRGLRLTEALAIAGGSTKDSDDADVRIIRGPLGRPRVYRADLAALVAGEGTDLALAPGDVIFVTEHWFATATDVVNRLVPSLATVSVAASVLRR
jgi:polysaccharide export outer membrane protein